MNRQIQDEPIIPSHFLNFLLILFKLILNHIVKDFLNVQITLI